MDAAKDPNSLENYRKTLTKDDGSDPYKTAAIQRTSLTEIFNDSLKLLLDEQSTCTLLEHNLNEYSRCVDELHVERVDEVLARAGIKQPVALASRLSDIDLQSIMEPLPCSTSNDLNCPASETVSPVAFQQFLDCLHRKKGTSVLKDLPSNNLRKIAKSFGPQTCGNKERITVRTNNVMMRSNSNLEGTGTSSRLLNEPRKIERQDSGGFRTARDELQLQNSKKFGTSGSGQSAYTVGQKRKLGTGRNVNSKFVSPLLSSQDSDEMQSKADECPVEVDERLKNIDPKMVELIKSEIMDCGSRTDWSDIAGLEFAKTAIQEAVIWPMLRPDIFTGLRRPPKGILLFGPPGTGKTLIGKCVASQSKSTFFSISASSLTSKWIGDGEKMVRALFAVARCHQPAVIFIDEVDSLLSQRSDTEHESSRRIKTEFLVQLDGATTENDERLLVIGATNRPQELDEAARRRFVKRLYIPLPDLSARLQLVKRLISGERHCLADEDFEVVAQKTDGYSGADIKTLCSEASLGPIRAIDMSMIEKIDAAEVRPLMRDDFNNALSRVRSSVSPKDLDQYVVWDGTYGSGSGF